MKREWTSKEIVDHYEHRDEPIGPFVSADYCESLEREVRALREICEASSITLKSYSLPNRIRDEREKAE